MAPMSLEQVVSLGIHPEQKDILIVKGVVAAVDHVPRAAGMVHHRGEQDVLTVDHVIEPDALELDYQVGNVAVRCGPPGHGPRQFDAERLLHPSCPIAEAASRRRR